MSLGRVPDRPGLKRNPPSATVQVMGSDRKRKAKKRKKANQNRRRLEAQRSAPPGRSSGPGRCGLCGKSGPLTRTPCCDREICDDEDSYRLFSFARNSCFRNHTRYTLCGAHVAEEHEGDDWKTCGECREHYMETEMYVWAGTNEYNFETLPNPPSFEPTRCSECNRRIRLGEDGYTLSAGGIYTCMSCRPPPERPDFGPF